MAQQAGAEVRRGAVEMVAAMLISGTIGWLVVASGQPPQNVVLVRCALGAPTLAAICMSLGLIRRDLLTWRTFGLAAAGGVAIVANWVLLFAAYSRASISMATIAYNTPRWPPKLPHLWPPKFPHPGHGAMRR